MCIHRRQVAIYSVCNLEFNAAKPAQAKATRASPHPSTTPSSQPFLFTPCGDCPSRRPTYLPSHQNRHNTNPHSSSIWPKTLPVSKSPSHPSHHAASIAAQEKPRSTSSVRHDPRNYPTYLHSIVSTHRPLQPRSQVKSQGGTIPIFLSSAAFENKLKNSRKIGRALHWRYLSACFNISM